MNHQNTFTIPGTYEQAPKSSVEHMLGSFDSENKAILRQIDQIYEQTNVENQAFRDGAIADSTTLALSEAQTAQEIQNLSPSEMLYVATPEIQIKAVNDLTAYIAAIREVYSDEAA